MHSSAFVEFHLIRLEASNLLNAETYVVAVVCQRAALPPGPSDMEWQQATQTPVAGGFHLRRRLRRTLAHQRLQAPLERCANGGHTRHVCCSAGGL